MSTPLLEVRGLGKRYGDTWAVRDLNLSIHRGEVYGLLGPNGAGKTTTMRMLAGLLEATTGTVQIDGHDPRKQPMEAKRLLGFLTGNTRLYMRLTPIEMLTFFGKFQEWPRPKLKARIAQLTEELGLEEFASRPCGTLSTGQTQRVNIARALLHEPRLLILDEPTAGLDIISADFILQAIRRCQQEGRAVLFSTHILAETELLSDRIGILHKGHLTLEGDLPAILAKTGTESLAKAFLHSVQSATNAEKADTNAKKASASTPESNPQTSAQETSEAEESVSQAGESSPKTGESSPEAGESISQVVEEKKSQKADNGEESSSQVEKSPQEAEEKKADGGEESSSQEEIP